MNFKVLIAPLVIASLIFGLLAGLFRIGWIELNPIRNMAALHGALMTGSFLGSLISLERAIPMKKWYAYLVPLVSALSIVGYILGWTQLSAILLTTGSFGLMSIMYYFYYKYGELYQIIMFVGASSWFIGNVLLVMQSSMFSIVPWWIGFLLLTITGERLELSKYLALSRGKKLLLVAALVVYISGCIIPFHSYGNIFLGVGFFLSATWLLKWDIAGKSLKRSGIFQYNAIMLTMGYLWLMIAGLMAIFLPFSGLIYDAVLHGFFIGFTFSMIFAHAPIIMPAVAGLTGQLYHKSLYIWGILLHVSLVLRIWADINVWIGVRKLSGIATGMVILLFIGEMAILALNKTLRKNSAVTSPRKKTGHGTIPSPE